MYNFHLFVTKKKEIKQMEIIQEFNCAYCGAFTDSRHEQYDRLKSRNMCNDCFEKFPILKEEIQLLIGKNMKLLNNSKYSNMFLDELNKIEEGNYDAIRRWCGELEKFLWTVESTSTAALLCIFDIEELEQMLPN